MSPSELCIRRPVMTTLVMLALVISGLIGFRMLPVNALPNVDFPTIVVQASLPGASPETMAAAVATPLEKQFSTIAGLESLHSSSALGSTQITLQLSLGRSIDAAAQDVQSAITSAGALLPPDMPSPPSYQKVNPADQPVLYLAIKSASLPLADVDEYAETFIAQHLSMVSGVAQVQVYGQQKYAVRARLDPSRLASKGIGLDDIATAMVAGNVKQPTGALHGRYQAYTIAANDQVTNAAGYRRLVVAWRKGAPVRLGDLGQVIDSVQNDRVAAWVGSERAIMLAVQRQPGSNTVQVVDNLRKALPDLVAKLPAAAQVDILYDLSTSVRDSVHDVEWTLLLTIGLVVAVIYAFLRNASATIIASLALPVSIIGTFAAMSALGFSLNNLTLMALTLSVGFVVDDAIVVLENIVRHMELRRVTTPQLDGSAGPGRSASLHTHRQHGDEPLASGEEARLTCALEGLREIGFTVISMTLSLVAVFLPVLLMGGMLGRLFKEFSVTISVAILVSGFVSLTLTPMLCSRFLSPQPDAHQTSQQGWFERAFAAWTRLYEGTLDAVLAHQGTTLLLSLVLLGVTGWMFTSCPKGFMPTEDTGQIVAYTEAAPSISYAAMVAHQGELAAIVARDPEVATFVSSVGSGGASATSNQGSLLIYLKERSLRRHSAAQIIERLRPQLAQVPGIRAYLQNPPTINIGGLVTKSQYQYTLQCPDTAALEHWTPLLARELEALPGLRDVTTDRQEQALQVQIDVDRDKASLMGLTLAQVDQALGSAYGSKQVSTIYASTNEYQVLLEVDPRYTTDPNLLDRLYVHASNGTLLPLSTVARFRPSSAPLLVSHSGQLAAATLSFNLAPGASLSEVLPRVQRAAAALLPRSVSGSFQGTAASFVESSQGLWELLLLAILVIYVVLGVLYESFVHPLTILAGLPSAGLGALVTLRLFGADLDVYAFLGLIMLVGIVKKNAIMMVDFALGERERGVSPYDAIRTACLVRFRPIMMTTLAALMGSLPIAVGAGAGAESRQPLGLAVVGGLMVSQLLTLYITPVVYLYLESWFPSPQAQPLAGPEPLSANPAHSAG